MPTQIENISADAISHLLLFKYMKSDELEHFITQIEMEVYEEGEMIISEGDLHPYLYLVVDGAAAVNVKESEGNDVYVSSIGEGEIFGEAGIFLNVRRTANVVCLDESTIIRIHREKLLEFIRSYPSTGIKILMVIIYSLLRKLRESNQELAYERKSVVSQDDIDAIVASVMNET